MRTTSNSLKYCFRLISLALETLVQLAVIRIVVRLFAQISQNTLIEAIPHCSASVLVPKESARCRKAHVAEAGIGVTFTSNATFLDTHLGSSDHVGNSNESRQVLSSAADAAGSDMRNDRNFIEIGGFY
jgi:hypothetical protein